MITVPGWMVLNSYSILLMIFLLILTLKSGNIHSDRAKFYLSLVIITPILLLSDSFGRMTLTSSNSILIKTSVFINFAFEPFELVLWLCYAMTWFPRRGKNLKIWILIPTVMEIVNLAVSILNLKYGWLYYYDENMIYHRGPLFIARILWVFAMIGFAETCIIIYRRYIERRFLATFMLFPVPSIIGTTFQAIFYGLALGLTGTSFMVLAIYIFIQNRNMDMDYLTGAYNRKYFDATVRNRIRLSMSGNTFSAIMIDLDHFKEINDSWGHRAGDTALENTVQLLQQTFRTDDMIARYGGDEFCIITDIAKKTDLDNAIARLKRGLEVFNENSKQPFKLSFSIGSGIYDTKQGMTADEFMNLIDDRMYQEKKEKHLERS